MADCIIHPVPLFEFSFDKSLMTYLLNFGQLTTMVGYAWYIEGPKEKILVDAGHSKYLKLGGIAANEIQTLESGLNKLGISFSDIDLIILTHLHHDHMAQASRFPKAKVLVQSAELEFARNPHRSFAAEYRKELLDGLKFEVISGDIEVCKDVSVLSTPGHSPGGQSVSIKTAQGIVIIAGLCTIRDNFYPPPPIRRPIITPGIHTNALEAYDSALRVKENANIVIPLHDSEFLRRSSIP